MTQVVEATDDVGAPAAVPLVDADPARKRASLATSLPLFVLLLSVFLTFLPVLVITYGYSDDYTQLAVGTGEAVFHISTQQGRPIAGLLQKWAFDTVKTVDGLAVLRGISVAGLLGTAYVTYVMLRRGGHPREQAAAMAFVLVTLPTSQVFAAWAVMFGVYIGVIMAAASALLAFTSARDPLSLKGVAYAGAAFLLLVASILIYQPAAMTYWLYAAILMTGPRATVKIMVGSFMRVAFVGGLALGAGFLVFKRLTAAYGAHTAGRGGVTEDVWGKVTWFFEEPLFNALNLNSILPTAALAIAVGVFIAPGLLFYFSGSPVERAVKFVIALLFVPLTYLPNLIAIESWASYRTLIALSPLVAYYAFLALRGYAGALGRGSETRYRPWVSAATALWAVVAACAASRNLTAYLALPQLLEYRSLKSQLAGMNLVTGSRLLVIRPQWYDGPCEIVRYDEFGAPSSYQPWAAPAMVQVAFRELGGDPAGLTIVHVGADEVTAPPPEGNVLDLREAKKLR